MKSRVFCFGRLLAAPAGGRSVLMVLLADRFVFDHGSWVDIATGQVASVRIRDAVRDPTGWAERCASMAVLRHPLINPLIDYGACDASRVFEAYAVNPAASASGPTAARLLAHVAQFLQTQGVPVAPDVAAFFMREVREGPPASGRPIGVVLRRRAALDTIQDVLDAQAPAGTIHVDVAGPPGSGLTTLQILAAREARLRGYVPVAAHVLPRFPWLLDLLPTRHVCLFVVEPAPEPIRRMVSVAIARIAAASARHHVLVRWHRTTSSIPLAVLLDSLGAAAMTGMVFVDRELGPSPAELFEAARKADGRPGAFLRALRAAGFPPTEPRYSLAHESAQPYQIPARPAPAGPGALSSGAAARTAALANADQRAEALAKAGRHAAACRLLTRAARVLEGRGEPVAAARCLCSLGWILRSRGRSDRALEGFDRCAALAGSSAVAIDAVIARGVVQTDEGRLVEAEATLRGASVAAQSFCDPSRARAASLALARTLLWQGRFDECSSLLDTLRPVPADDPSTTEVRALDARVAVHTGEARRALEAARQAVETASRHGDPRRTATAHRAMAIVLADLGDAEGAREHARKGLAAAGAAHLPLFALKLRLAAGPPGACRRARHLPRLLDAQLNAAAGGDLAAVVRDTGAKALMARDEHRRPFARVEALLEMSHAAPDDRTALARICTHVCGELRASTAMIASSIDGRHVLASAGKPWQGDASICAQALGSGRGVPADPRRQPQQAAEAIRYGGSAIAALACRWTAGTSVNARAAEEVLRAAALAAAGSVRALLDERPVSANTPPGSRELLGDSAPTVALREAIARAARAPFPVLIEGESGSGKELVARAVHRLSPRRERRWCAVNCAAIADDLLEAELFGHARGAFTGATGERAGLFEEADGGTLFLDEVGDLSSRAQAKLLRVLQDGEVRRVGENLPRRVDARVVAATNHRLEDDVAAGRFRADLRFRLDVVRITVPPLRERIGDIPPLALHFWRAASAQVGSSAMLAPETLSALARYDWPGNVRELQNAIAWMAVHSPRRGRVGPAALPATLAQATTPRTGTFEVAREEFERRFVRAALARAGGRRSRAADALGVSRQGLAKMLRRLNIDLP